MSATIDYFFTSISPWAYLGHDAARALAAKHGATLVPRPVNLPELFNVSGQVPLAQRAGVRQRYRMIELQRFAHYRGKPMNFRPAHFPVDPALADHTVCAIIASGSDPLDYMEAVFSAVWVNELNIADEDTLAGLLSAAGVGAAGILAKAKGAEAAAIRSKNTEDAIASMRAAFHVSFSTASPSGARIGSTSSTTRWQPAARRSSPCDEGRRGRFHLDFASLRH